MTTTDDVAPIRISGPAGLLAVVPSMLGFHPTNSLVLMCISGGRRRVGPVARVDLAKGHDRAMAAHLANHARNHADEVVVISYQNSSRRPPMLDDLLSALALAGIEVMDALVVRGGRVRPALNAATERAHPGFPVPDSDDPQVRQLAAAGALAGRTVLSDREQLRQSIAGPRGARLAQAQRYVSEAAAGRLPIDGDPPPTRVPTVGPGTVHYLPFPGSGAVAEHVLRIGPIPDDVDDLLRQAFLQVSATGEVSVRVATALAVVLTDDRTRDAVLIRAVAEVDRPWLPLLIASATWTPDALAPPLCSVLAMVAYRHGDGALAQIAVDRCLAAEPRHGLAHMMVGIMSAGLRPEELERIARVGLGSPSPDGDVSCAHAACGELDCGRIADGLAADPDTGVDLACDDDPDARDDLAAEEDLEWDDRRCGDLDGGGWPFWG